MLACPERFSNMCDMRYPDILIMILYQSGRVLASSAGGPGFNPKSRTASYQRRYKNGTSSSQDLTQDLPHSWFVKSMGFKKVLQPIKDQLATMVIMYFVYTVLYTFIGVFITFGVSVVLGLTLFWNYYNYIITRGILHSIEYHRLCQDF